MDILSFMAIATVVTNCILLYYSSETLRVGYKEFLGIDSDIVYFQIIVLLEHCIIVIKLFMISIIPDIPQWV